MLKSSPSHLQNRGLVTDDEVNQYLQLSNEHLLDLLLSEQAIKRTLAAKVIAQRKDSCFIDDLIHALAKESKLYSKIAIAETLGQLGIPAVQALIPYLGQIGNNQHRYLPNQPFLKNNYPLPRDIVARIIAKTGCASIPILIEQLDRGNISQLSEGIDAIGYISYYGANSLAKSYLLGLAYQYKSHSLILWKLIRALQAFPKKNVIDYLQHLINETTIEQHRWEACRSLKRIHKTLSCDRK